MNYEEDSHEDFADEMSEILGEENVHRQLPLAHGTTLKIDFHIGPPQQTGVGVEFKMPKNNGELQRGLGQVDQYQERYGQELIVVLLKTDYIDQAKVQFFVNELRRKGIVTVVKDRA